MAERLRAAGFNVEESVVSRRVGEGGAVKLTPAAPDDRYDVFVSGASAEDVKAKLEGRNMSVSPVAGGVVLTPSLPRAEADTVLRELAGTGWRVSIRRAASWPDAAPSMPAKVGAPATTGSQETLHRVRVGSYPDRASVEEARRALKAKGYASFVAPRGEP